MKITRSKTKRNIAHYQFIQPKCYIWKWRLIEENNPVWKDSKSDLLKI